MAAVGETVARVAGADRGIRRDFHDLVAGVHEDDVQRGFDIGHPVAQITGLLMDRRPRPGGRASRYIMPCSISAGLVSNSAVIAVPSGRVTVIVLRSAVASELREQAERKAAATNVGRRRRMR